MTAIFLCALLAAVPTCFGHIFQATKLARVLILRAVAALSADPQACLRFAVRLAATCQTKLFESTYEISNRTNRLSGNDFGLTDFPEVHTFRTDRERNHPPALTPSVHSRRNDPLLRHEGRPCEAVSVTQVPEEFEGANGDGNANYEEVDSRDREEDHSPQACCIEVNEGEDQHRKESDREEGNGKEDDRQEGHCQQVNEGKDFNGKEGDCEEDNRSQDCCEEDYGQQVDQGKDFDCKEGDSQEDNRQEDNRSQDNCSQVDEGEDFNGKEGDC